MVDDFCYILIVISTLGHILCQNLVAKIPIGHGGESKSRTSDLQILRNDYESVIKIIFQFIFETSWSKTTFKKEENEKSKGDKKRVEEGEIERE